MSKKATRKGLFITIEGGEGVGKSSFLRAFCEQLAAVAPNVIQTREPGGTPSADRIRALFAAPPVSDPLLMETEFLLVSAARAQHVGKLVKPALARGDWVVSDRFADSSRVYQGIIGGVNKTFIEQTTKWAAMGVRPDATIVLDCPVDTALARLGARKTAADGTARYDQAAKAWHERVRKGFLTLAKKEPRRFIVVDAQQPISDSVAQVGIVLKRRFPRIKWRSYGA